MHTLHSLQLQPKNVLQNGVVKTSFEFSVSKLRTPKLDASLNNRGISVRISNVVSYTLKWITIGSCEINEHRLKRPFFFLGFGVKKDSNNDWLDSVKEEVPWKEIW